MLKVLVLEMFLWLNWVTYFRYVTPVLLQEVLLKQNSPSFFEFVDLNIYQKCDTLLLPTAVFFNLDF